MAAPMARLVLRLFKNGPVLSNYPLQKACVEPASCGFSAYAPYFIDPTFKKDKLDEMFESGDAQKKAHIPIKAACNDDTCSVFHNEMVRKLTNYVMKAGHKALARELVEKTFENIKRIQLERLNKIESPEERMTIITNPETILANAINNSRPILQLSPIKRGGVTYQVPVPITHKRSLFLAIKWTLSAANDKQRTQRFSERLARELLDAANGMGRVVQRKQELHRQCEANRAYAHYRWS